MAGIFVTSIGTEVGKTLVTCALLHQMFKAGVKVQAIKPIASGLATHKQTDPMRLLRAMGMPQHQSAIAAICPWQYDEPIAPHIAARRTGKPIIWRELLDFCLQSLNQSVTTIIEGAGGLMSPIDNERTMLDLAIALDLPTVLVASNYLGAISHTLTALKVMEHNNVKLAAIVISEAEDSSVDEAEMIRIIKQASYQNAPIFWIPRLSHDSDNYKQAPSFEALWNNLPRF